MRTRRHAFVVAILLTVAGGVANAQIPSQRTRMGFNGPVRTVKVELQDYTWENSGWDPGEPLYDVIRYDRNGRCLTRQFDPGSGWRPYGEAVRPPTANGPRRYEVLNKSRTWKTVWQFDKQGRLERFEEYALYKDGRPPALAHWEHYSYDSQGRIEEFTFWGDWGWSPGQTEPYPPIRLRYSFDSAGRIAGWFTVDEPIWWRSTLTYDNKGRLVKQIDELPDGKITTHAWEGYDEYGNWTVHTMINAWRTDNVDDPQSKSVVRRSITYGRAPKKRA
ncbi:MAG TPA: hypothetical protein VFR78_00925 [Pyrinomonadaceae bacterium]|nr:hypothetical protein [Pyrinomonadaceae bacterium]